MRPAGRHEVDGLDRAQGNHPGIAARVAHHAHGLHRQEHGEGLTGLVVPAGAVQFFDEDGIGTAQHVAVFLLHFAQNAHAQAGAGERMAVHLSLIHI